MGQAQSDLARWVAHAVSWQIRTVSAAQLQTDATAVTQDLAKAQGDAIEASKCQPRDHDADRRHFGWAIVTTLAADVSAGRERLNSRLTDSGGTNQCPLLVGL